MPPNKDSSEACLQPAPSRCWTKWPPAPNSTTSPASEPLTVSRKPSRGNCEDPCPAFHPRSSPPRARSNSRIRSDALACLLMPQTSDRIAATSDNLAEDSRLASGMICSTNCTRVPDYLEQADSHPATRCDAQRLLRHCLDFPLSTCLKRFHMFSGCDIKKIYELLQQNPNLRDLVRDRQEYLTIAGSRRYPGGGGSPHYILEDSSPWQHNAIRAYEDRFDHLHER